jgi:hypothetical protein
MLSTKTISAVKRGVNNMTEEIITWIAAIGISFAFWIHWAGGLSSFVK